MVFFYPAEFQKSGSVEITDATGKIVDISKWLPGQPFYREFIVPVDEYKIILPGPIRSFTLKTYEKVPTFIQIEKYPENQNEEGVRLTLWRGQPNAAIAKALSQFRSLGSYKEIVEPVPLHGVGNIISINTEPPWQVPPGPKPPSPQPK